MRPVLYRFGAHLAEPDAAKIISPSQGAHLVLDRSFLPGDNAIMVPHTSDGRVMFAIPGTDTTIVEPRILR